MLFARSDKYDDNDNENQSLLWWTTCNGYFLSLKGKLLHLYPVVHDMVEIKGNYEQVWKAWLQTRGTINAQCLVEGGT